MGLPGTLPEAKVVEGESKGEFRGAAIELGQKRVKSLQPEEHWVEVEGAVVVTPPGGIPDAIDKKELRGSSVPKLVQAGEK